MSEAKKLEPLESRYQVYRVSPEEALEGFMMCQHWISEALERGHGEYLPIDIYRALQDREMFLAVCLDVEAQRPVGCVVVQMLVFPRKKVLHVVAGGGKRPGFDWIPAVLGELEAIARKVGATAITGYTFPQLARLAHRYGYMDWYSVVGKELGNESLH